MALPKIKFAGGVFGGPLKKKPGMQMSIISFDGECVPATYGQMASEDAAHVQRFLEDMVRVIRDYAEA